MHGDRNIRIGVHESCSEVAITQYDTEGSMPLYTYFHIDESTKQTTGYDTGTQYCTRCRANKKRIKVYDIDPS